MKPRFTHIVLRLTYDDSLRAEFEKNGPQFIKKHKLKLTPSQRKALLSKSGKLLHAEIEKEWAPAGKRKATTSGEVPAIPWPVRDLTWPVRG